MRATTSTNYHLFWGILLIFFGALFLLDNMRIMDVGDFFSDFWPLILIIIGLKIILSRKKSEDVVWEETESYEGAEASSMDDLHENRFIGDMNIKVNSVDFRGGSISSFISDIKLDFSDIKIAEGDHYLNISGFIGDVHLILPKEQDYVINVSVTIGDIVLPGDKRSGFALNRTYQTGGYESATARLHIQNSLFIGDVHVS